MRIRKRHPRPGLKRSVALVALLALLGTVVTLPAAQAADVVTVIDDATTGSGLDQFNFDTGWSTSTGLPGNDYVAGTEHWPKGSTSSLSLKFSGTKVRILGVKAPNHGQLAVSIDGGAETVVDAYASQRMFKQLLFESALQTNREHTVTMRVTGAKNAASTGIGASIDSAEVVAPERVDAAGGIVDDAVTAGINHFGYGTGWTAGTGNSTVNYQNGTEHWAKPTNNPTLTFSFTGVLATLHGVKAPEHGIYAVSVDGGPEVPADAWAAGRLFKQEVFSTGLLAYGAHTVTLRLTGTKNAAATGADGEIDFATVYLADTPATGIEMDTSPLRMLEGQQQTLSATVLPEGAIDRGIVWSSSNAAVATVSASGVLTALALGTATLKAANAKGTVTASRTLEVTGIGPGLNGAVGDTNFHYVVKKTFDDYQRKYFDDIVQMKELSWQGTGWRGDSVNAQFVLWTGADAQSKVSVAASDLTGPGGAKIPTANINLDFLRSVMAGQGNPSAGRPQESIPDILNGNAPVALAARSVQGVWMNVDVPAAAAPGTYTGTVTARSAEGMTVTFAVNLDVLDMMLPPANQWDQFVDLWQNPYAIARVANIPNDQLFTKTHFDAMLPYYKKLAAGGQDVITATVVSDPWGGQTYDKYGSMVKWSKTPSGEWKFDYTDFDAWVNFMMNDVGITGQIDAYSMVNWASKVLYFDQATGKDINAQVNVGSPEWNAMWGAFLDDFGPHLKAKGWFDKTYMAMDERPLNDIMKAVDLINVHAPGLKVGAAMNYNSLDDARLDKIDKISVGSYYVDLGDPEFAAVAKHRDEAGLITSMYNCVGHFPNSFTRSNPAEGYWVQWKTLATGSDGYLRWAFDSFVQDPFTTTDFRTWDSGDSAQIYPGALSSVRWEKTTEGVRDAEKVRILSKLSPTAATDLDALMAGMKNPGMAEDPFGGVIDPGVVDIPKEADRLRAGLNTITRRYVESLPVHATGVTLDNGSLKLQVGDSAQLRASVMPASADNQAVTWKVSDAAVLGVNAAPGTVRLAAVEPGTATLTAKAPGKATVTVTTLDGGFTALATVTVTAAATEEPTPSATATAPPTDAPTATPTAVATPTASSTPTAAGPATTGRPTAGTPGATATSQTAPGSASPTAGPGAGGLASTGAGSTLAVGGMLGLLMMLVGVGAVASRRRSH